MKSTFSFAKNQYSPKVLLQINCSWSQSRCFLFCSYFSHHQGQLTIVLGAYCLLFVLNCVCCVSLSLYVWLFSLIESPFIAQKKKRATGCDLFFIFTRHQVKGTTKQRVKNVCLFVCLVFFCSDSVSCTVRQLFVVSRFCRVSAHRKFFPSCNLLERQTRQNL